MAMTTPTALSAIVGPLGALGVLFVTLNSTMIVVALPDIMNTFGVGVRTAGWSPPT